MQIVPSCVPATPSINDWICAIVAYAGPLVRYLEVSHIRNGFGAFAAYSHRALTMMRRGNIPRAVPS